MKASVIGRSPQAAAPRWFQVSRSGRWRLPCDDVGVASHPSFSFRHTRPARRTTAAVSRFRTVFRGELCGIVETGDRHADRVAVFQMVGQRRPASRAEAALDNIGGWRIVQARRESAGNWLISRRRTHERAPLAFWHMRQWQMLARSARRQRIADGAALAAAGRKADRFQRPSVLPFRRPSRRRAD